MDTWMRNGPVVIGGVGGSGTRVVAEILREVGFYLGADLNLALDNLWFTLLLKRPRLFHKKSALKVEVCRGFSILEKIMKGESGLSWREYKFLISAISEMMVFGHDYLRAGKGCWPLKRAISMLSKNRLALRDYIGWGWKEPNTHIFIEYLAEYFSNLKYIHVIRHGLDMAYHNNQSQLYNWGSLFGVEKPKTLKDLPVASLEYWIKANQKAIRLGKNILNERFLLINFDQLCETPKIEVEKILTFLEFQTNDIDFINRICLIPRKPSSIGRYKNHDLACFPERSLDEVRKLGFNIEE